MLIQYGYSAADSTSSGVYCTFPISYTVGYKVILCPVSRNIAWQGNPPCLMSRASELNRFMWAVYGGGGGIISWISISS